MALIATLRPSGALGTVGNTTPVTLSSTASTLIFGPYQLNDSSAGSITSVTFKAKVMSASQDVVNSPTYLFRWTSTTGTAFFSTATPPMTLSTIATLARTTAPDGAVWTNKKLNDLAVQLEATTDDGGSAASTDVNLYEVWVEVNGLFCSSTYTYGSRLQGMNVEDLGGPQSQDDHPPLGFVPALRDFVPRKTDYI